MITHTNDWAKAYCDPAIKVIKEKEAKLSKSKPLERGQTNATAQVLKLKQANPDFILDVSRGRNCHILERCEEARLGEFLQWGQLGLILENTLERLGDKDAVKDYYVLHAFVDKVDGPKMKKWNDIILKYNPKETITGFSAVSMASGVAAVKALKAAGRNVTRSKFISELDKIRGLTTGILACDITWSSTDRHGCKKSAVAGFVNGSPTVLSSWEKPW